MMGGGLASALQPQGGLLQRLLGGGAPSSGGLGQRLQDILNPQVALPMAGAMIAGRTPAAGFGDALALGGMGLGKLNETRKTEAEKKRTIDYLTKAHPDLAQAIDMGLPVGDAWGEALKRDRGEDSKPTDDMREYTIAKSQGFEGSFMDYMIKMKEAGRNQIDINTGEKLPTGFRWINPDQKEMGVEPIPGGPGEQIPGELAARVGVADSFLAQLPGIKARVKKGEVTGPIDRGLAGAGYGNSGELFRQIETGADVLQRFLTGAGMPASEAAEYARRYKPTYADTSESMLSKLDQLERELRSAKEMAMRGRGGVVSPDGGDGWTEVSPGVRIRKKN